MNKYHSKRTDSALCQRTFASKKEAARADELKLLEMAGEIKGLEFQNKIILSVNPRVTITIDFYYEQDGKAVWEDSKGVLTRDFRTKMIWLEQLYGIKVVLS